jgi:hypothetical protein
VRSFAGQIELVDRVTIVQPLDEQETLVWTNLKNRMVKRNKERNNIAHFTLISHNSTELGDGYAIAPMFSPAVAAALGQPKLLTELDLAQIEQRFVQLAGEAVEFGTILLQRRGILGGTPEPLEHLWGPILKIAPDIRPEI